MEFLSIMLARFIRAIGNFCESLFSSNRYERDEACRRKEEQKAERREKSRPIRNKFSVLSFEKKYKQLISDMRRTDAPDDTMLYYVLLYPVYRRYYAKESCFYHDNKCALSFFCFIYASLMITVQLTQEDKNRICNNSNGIFVFFDELFAANSREMMTIQFTMYKEALDSKLNIVDVFISLLKSLKNQQNCNFTIEKEISLVTECQIFFIEQLPSIIECAKKWCEANKVYVEG